jgi:Fe2+ transport system protein FeoA
MDKEKFMSLDRIKVGQSVKIHSLDESNNDHKYLISLGVLPGDVLKVTGKGTFGGPISCKHENETFFALRRDYAKKVLVTEIQ